MAQRYTSSEHEANKLTGAPPSSHSARIVQLEGPYQLVWRDEILPVKAAPGSLICKTTVSAISPGTELGAYVGLPPLRDGTGYPRVQGYCNVAIVLDVGDGVLGFAPGDRVLSFTSHRSHFQIPASEILLSLDPAMDAGHIAVSYLFHLGYEAVLRSGVQAGARVVVIGMGALGLAAVALAARSGATVICVTEHPRAAERAYSLGARAVMSRRDMQALSAVEADVVITTTNAWNDWSIALRVAGRRGRIAVLGFPGRGEPSPLENPLDSRQFYAKQLRIEAVGEAAERPDSRGLLRFNERDNLYWIAGEIHAARLRAEVLISGRFAASRVEDAYRALLAHEGSPVTFLLHWTE